MRILRCSFPCESDPAFKWATRRVGKGAMLSEPWRWTTTFAEVQIGYSKREGVLRLEGTQPCEILDFQWVVQKAISKIGLPETRTGELLIQYPISELIAHREFWASRKKFRTDSEFVLWRLCQPDVRKDKRFSKRTDPKSHLWWNRDPSGVNVEIDEEIAALRIHIQRATPLHMNRVLSTATSRFFPPQLLVK